MRLTISRTHDSGGREIAEKLAQRLDIPCYITPCGKDLPLDDPCILLEEREGATPAAAPGEVRVLIHRGDCAESAGYDLAVNSGPLGEEGTVELLSQFVALKVMTRRRVR